MTDELIQKYAAVSGDQNPIHLSKTAANEVGFPDKMAHGMLAMAIRGKMISQMIQEGWIITEFKIRFQSPLFIHDKLEIVASQIESSEKYLSLKLSGKNQHR